MFMQHQPTPSANMVSEVAVISGASGFIGSHLARKLVLQGLKVVAIPRDILSRTELLQEFLQRYSPSYIFHLAAYGNHSNQTNVAETVSVNYGDTYSLLVASRHIPYKAFINVSSSSVLLPYETLYSASKAGAERLCKAFAMNYDKPIVTVRPYSVYGPGEASFRFIPTVFRSCLTKQTLHLSADVVHDWIYVETFVEGMINTAIKYVNKYKAKSINFGTGIGRTNAEVVKKIEEITGYKAKILYQNNMRPYDNKEWVCQNDKDTYQWTDEYMPTLSEGLLQTYESYK